jgi:hypothetical protein
MNKNIQHYYHYERQNKALEAALMRLLEGNREHMNLILKVFEYTENSIETNVTYDDIEWADGHESDWGTQPGHSIEILLRQIHQKLPLRYTVYDSPENYDSPDKRGYDTGLHIEIALTEKALDLVRKYL